MKGTFRTLAIVLLSVGGALGVAACSSGDNPGNYGDACTVYAVGASCSGDLLCRCILENEDGCFCTQPCTVSANCPGKYDQCLLANDPSHTDVLPNNFCFQFLPDGGPLP